MIDPIPPNATSIFLFSPRDQIARDQGALPRQSYATTDGTKTAYTKEIAADPDAAIKIADYEKLNPDARIVGYGTADTQKSYSPPPRLALSLTP